jgi:DNA (cytosine-5)-methyltransferase 1
MTRPRLLDLFSCEGGAAMGYYRAGFDVVGVDIAPQPRFPFAFVQGDALEYVAKHGHEFDAIHASPPCQGYSVTQSIHGKAYPMLIEDVRAALQATGRPYVIENVPGAPLLNPVELCGVMFGLKVYRHRLFETNPFMLAPLHTPHPPGSTTNSKGDYSSFAKGATHISVAGHNFSRQDAVIAMEIDWMSKHGLAQAIPPAYTEYIGGYLMQALGERVEVAL